MSRLPDLIHCLSLLLGAVLAAVGAGMLAATSSCSGWAPVGLFSLGVGIMVGLAAIALARSYRITCWKRLSAAALMMALVASAAEHLWLYRIYRLDWHAIRQREPTLALVLVDTAPMSFGEYLSEEHSPARLAFWVLDVALVAVGAVGAVLLWRSQTIAHSALPTTPNLPDP